MPTVPYTLAPGARAPTRATPGAAGLDLHAHLPDGPVYLSAGQRHVIPTGVRLALPPGYEAQVRPRSGLALKHGLTVLNSPGTIDADYRGEVAVVLVNHGQSPVMVTVRDGDRIAQLVIAPVTDAVLVEAADLPPTARGGAGFGSTGTGPVEEADDRARLEARVRRLEAEVLEARAERDKWAAELDGERAAVVAHLRAAAHAPHPMEADTPMLSPSGSGLLLLEAARIERGEHRAGGEE